MQVSEEKLLEYVKKAKLNKAPINRYKNLHSLLDKRARCRLKWALARLNIKEKVSYKEVIGIGLHEYAEYFKNKFEYGMTMENKHMWNIDHIVPLSCASNLEELKCLLHYTNTQPMWTKQNQEKNCNVNFNKKLKVAVNSDKKYCNVNELYFNIKIFE